jgi:hypothetical protein
MSALTYLPHARSAAIIAVVAACALAFASNAYAAEAGAKDAPQPNDDLDVTMQVIADPNAKLPDDVIRRIPLPPRKPDAAAPAQRDKAEDASSRSDERSREAREVGVEISERAQERSQNATQQREQARRAVADERRRNPDPPRSPPDPPRPPR